MPFTGLFLSLLMAVGAVMVAHELLDQSRRVRQAGEPWRRGPERAALAVLALVVLVTLASVLMLTRGAKDAASMGCLAVPAQIGLLTLAGGMRVLTRPARRGDRAGTGLLVALLWLVTFGVGVCYAAIVSRGIGG